MMINDNAGAREDERAKCFIKRQERKLISWGDQWLFDVKRCYKSCCVFIICKFQTAVEFGSARVQRKQGPHLPDHQSSRVLNVTLIIIAWFLPQAYLTKGHIFSCFRDGGKRFDAEFQGSHHQLDKQEIFHIWYENENKGVKWTKWMYNPRWSGFCRGSWETSSKPNLWSFAGSSRDLPQVFTFCYTAMIVHIFQDGASDFCKAGRIKAAD